MSKDKNGVTIHLKDKVQYETTQMEMYSEGVSTTHEGIVTGIYADGMLMVQSENSAPQEMPGTSVVVTHSLIRNIRDLRSNEELLEVLEGAEKRYAAAVEQAGKKKGKGKGTSTRAPAKAKPAPIALTLKL